MTTWYQIIYSDGTTCEPLTYDEAREKSSRPVVDAGTKVTLRRRYNSIPPGAQHHETLCQETQEHLSLRR